MEDKKSAIARLIAQQVLAGPRAQIGFFMRCAAHLDIPKYLELWLWIWGRKAKLGEDIDFNFLFQTHSCPACMRSLGVSPSDVFSFVRTNPALRSSISRQKNNLLGRLIIAEADDNQGQLSYLSKAINALEGTRNGAIT